MVTTLPNRSAGVQDPLQQEMSVLAMMQICDSAFPSGAFALSNGLETFVQQERLMDADAFERYVRDWCDLQPYRELGQMMLACAIGERLLEYRKHSVSQQHTNCSEERLRNPAEELLELDEVANAANISSEVRGGSTRMCSSVRKIVKAYASDSLLLEYGRSIDAGNCLGAYPITVGLFAASIGMEARQAGSLYAHSQLNALTLCAVKCVPLKQSDGQRILFSSREEILRAVDRAGQVSIEELGISGPMMEMSAMQHECLYSRLFMS
jgi:urease accessory protein